MRRKNYDWDEQNGQWEGYGGHNEPFDSPDTGQYDWNVCYNCSHCNLNYGLITGTCGLDGHSIRYDNECDYNLKREASDG